MSGMEEKKLAEEKKEKETPSLKGTFISVMLLGLFLVLSWAGAFALFISR
ncbi:cytochrome c oxidase subunit 2A [Ornithinibacillus sp. L9]|uniref:Cytochrome c oxidase subunit 2A n=1 Tax=Ornithinibacillus caprae TaxID=2678566 RepID=A0A6N8FJ05_9BACI|nr:cytochrome c oxidase subunit 2A [Ornithinibacillus caprae]MUK87308.1 cytochrome c oxidase subunit 2A [Ornithinibacillus caprae]